jgi:transcriptional regulator with GAF, ATPase, and Fis domain
VKQSTSYEQAQRNRDTLCAARLCSLLDSVRAMQEAGSSCQLREALGQHALALLRELVPADDAGLQIGDKYADAEEPLKRRHRKVEITQTRVADEKGNRYRIVAPLLVRGEPAGALTLERYDGTFGEADFLVISAIARMASITLENAKYVESLGDEVQRLRGELHYADNMAGESQAMKNLGNSIGRLAVRDTTVLITGESGTGKELVARSLHGQSSRAAAAFIAINCAALTETLLESELFGYEKGAFTGASTTKLGLLEAAQGGTVFLDEIGEMPVALQPKLLRVLQNRELQRVGGTKTIPLDVRVIAATNCDLRVAVRKGAFREDLLYRLNVVTLRTPPLRERPEDILPLAKHFARRFGTRCGRRMLGISADASCVLQGYEWPGNVRELENAIEHAAVLGTGDTILPEDLPETLLENWGEVSAPESGTLRSAVNSAKRTIVTHAFEMAGQDHVEAARLLGVHPNYLYRLIKTLHLQVF